MTLRTDADLARGEGYSTGKGGSRFRYSFALYRQSLRRPHLRRTPQQSNRESHGAYVAAINSNDVDTLVAGLTDDVVYQAPGGPEIISKGINIFRRGADGKWRVAIDGWSSDAAPVP
jgi:ketosteroid isomerase-like protein